MILLIMGLALLWLTLLMVSEVKQHGMAHFQILRNRSRQYGMIQFNVYVYLVLTILYGIGMFVAAMFFIYCGGKSVLTYLYVQLFS
jgi:hypothetical protein